MSELLTVEVTTRVFGLGKGTIAPPTFVVLRERAVSVRALIAEHVQAEVAEAERRRTSSLALHYMLAGDARSQPPSPADTRRVNVASEIKRAWEGFAKQRFMLVVDGVAVADLDAPLTLTERSRVSFIRLLPLVGG